MNKKILVMLIVLMFCFAPNIQALEGWSTENGEKYYYENGEKVSGFKEIDKKLYFFSRVNYALKKGWQNTSEGKWYQKADGEVVKGLQTINGKKYYFNDKGIMQTGFITLNDKIYFFSRVNGALKKGWQNAGEGKWYQKADGEVLIGSQEITGEKYYFNNNGIMQTGFITLNDKLYFYSRVNGALKKGWQNASEGYWYQNSNGEVVKGWQTISGNRYYFDDKGIEVRGFKTINNKLYFFSRVNGVLKTGWQHASEGKWYQNASGEVLTGLQELAGDKYYFNNNGIMQTGFVTINGKVYFFSRVNGKLKTGWQNTKEEGRWYQDKNGEVLIASGWQTVEGKEYYFEDKFVLCGMHEIEGKKYYFDDATCEKLTTTKRTKYKKIIINEETGEYIKTQYLPTYYSQKDQRWANKKYGLSTMGSTGCSPTSLAMIFTSYLAKEILPVDVAYDLYQNTSEFNRRMKGTSGKGVIYASNHFGIKYTGIDSKEKLVESLKEGKIVYAAMQNGTFATPRWNHAIIVFDYDESNDTTFAYDPLNTANNRWHKINLIWDEQSRDPDDRTGGYAIYALEK